MTLSILVFAACSIAHRTPPKRPAMPPVATFSIVAVDTETGDLGVAVQSRFLGVGSVVPWARAGVGTIATQAFANTTYGPEGLRLLAEGGSPETVVKTLTDPDRGKAYRQLGIVDAKGRAAAFTGEKTMAWSGHRVGEGFACQGNILAGEAVVEAMAKAFRASRAPLPERLVAALRAGQAAGGDKRGRQSAALLVVREEGGYGGFNDRYVDLRVEDHKTPIEEIGRILKLHRRVFGVAPLPGALAGYLMEPEPKEASTGSPRATWCSWMERFKARDFTGLYALHTKAYRNANAYEPWKASMEKNAGSIESFLERSRYAGTKVEGDSAKIALLPAGSRRSHVLSFRKEEGEWRIDLD